MSTSPATLKQYLYLFVMHLSSGVLLLDQLAHTKKIQRGMALAITTADEIRAKMDSADETQQRAMIVVSRDNLKEVRGLIMTGVFPMKSAKARKEWVEGTRQLLRDTEGVGRG